MARRHAQPVEYAVGPALCAAALARGGLLRGQPGGGDRSGAVAVGVRLGTAVRAAVGGAVGGHGHVCRAFVSSCASTGGPPTRRAWYSRWYGLAAFPVLVLTIVFLVRSFLYEPFRIPSASMHPTVPEGSYVIVSKAGFGQYGTFGIQPGAVRQRWPSPGATSWSIDRPPTRR